MSTDEERRAGPGAGRQDREQGAGQRRQRPDPLFPLEDDGARPTPPAPLGDLLGDLDDLLPRAEPRRRPQPPPRPASTPPLRASEAPANGSSQRGAGSPIGDAGVRSGATGPGERQRTATQRDPATRPLGAARDGEHGPGVERGPREATRGLETRQGRAESPAEVSGGGTPGPAADRSRGEPRQADAAARAQVTTQAARPGQDLRPARMQELLDEPASVMDVARARHESLDNDLARLQLHAARQSGGGIVTPLPPLVENFGKYVVLGVICLASLIVLFTLNGGGGPNVSDWGLLRPFEDGAGSRTALVGAARPAGDYKLKGPPSITPQQIDRILRSYNSPAAGTGEQWYNLGLEYGIDPAFAIAFFIHESSAGSNPNWAGIKPGGATTHNVGNIICAGYATCYGRFRDYPSWEAGIEDWYRLIDVEYLQGRGHQTVADIIPVYAPAFENDVQGYVNSVHGLVDKWRATGVR